MSSSALYARPDQPPAFEGNGVMPVRLALAVTACVAALFPAVGRAGSSNSLLDVSPDGGLLLAANADNYSVTVIDTKGLKAVHEVKVGRQPESVTWIGKGPLAAAACYRENLVVVFDASTSKVLHKLPVAPEPYGIVTDREGKRAWVTHEYPGTVSEIDLTMPKVV